MIKKCPYPKRYQKNWRKGQTAGNRTILAYKGLRFTPAVIGAAAKHATWQHYFQVICDLCGYKETVPQYRLRGFTKTHCCQYCPPKHRRDRAKKKQRAAEQRRTSPYRRPQSQESLWHLWVHNWMPPVSIELAGLEGGFDTRRQNYLLFLAVDRRNKICANNK